MIVYVEVETLILRRFIWVLFLFSTYFTGYVRTDTFKSRGNQYILVGQRFCTVNCWASVKNYQLSHIGLGPRLAAGNLRYVESLMYNF